jgi:hypothetical protein
MSFGWDMVGLLALSALGWTGVGFVGADKRADADNNVVGLVLAAYWMLVVASAVLNIVFPLHLLGSP